MGFAIFQENKESPMAASEEDISRAWLVQIISVFAFTFVALPSLFWLMEHQPGTQNSTSALAEISKNFSMSLVAEVLFVAASALIFWCVYLFFKLRGPIQYPLRSFKQYLNEILFGLLYFWCAAIFTAIVSILSASVYSKLYTNISGIGVIYYVVSIIAMILIHDFWFYIYHRILHTPFLYKYVHCIHHISTKTTMLTPIQMSPIEIVISALFLNGFTFIVPLHVSVPFIVAGAASLKSITSHCGYELYPEAVCDRPILRWITAVSHHDLHHSHVGCNFAFNFRWWDRFFGTEHPDYVATVRRCHERSRRIRESQK